MARQQTPSNLGAAPKVELHLHLEGATPLEALWALISKYGSDPELQSRKALVDHLQYDDFPHFIDTWWWMTGFIRSYDDFEHVAQSVAASLAGQRIVYAEASFSPTDFERHGLTTQEIALAIRRGLGRVENTKVVLNCDLVRNTGPERARRTLEAVIEVADVADVRGITIGGSEQEFPPELFADVYARAAAAGLRLTAHAGEAAGPASVRGALDALGVERIGHGVRTIEDPALLARVVAEQIPLEVCPTSNIRTGVVSGWDDHPVGVLIEAGANITISSDDPTFFHNSVAGDLAEVAKRFGADPRSLTQAAVDASWMTPEEKLSIGSTVMTWWDNHVPT